MLDILVSVILTLTIAALVAALLWSRYQVKVLEATVRNLQVIIHQIKSQNGRFKPRVVK